MGYKLQRLNLNAQTGIAGIDFIDVPAGGNAAWGSLTGTLSSQTDLQAALDAKQVAGSYATAARFFAVTFRCLNGTIWQEIARTAVQT